MINKEKFIEVFGEELQRQYITKSWWEQEYVSPTLDVKPKTGHWIEHEQNGIAHIECSECLTWFLRCHLLRNSFCPNCGCRMIDFEPQEREE